jgi:hypothetical protein
LGHIEEQCWEKNGRGPIAIANYLEVLVDDEKTTLAKLNWLCEANNNVFSRTKVPRWRNLIVALEVDRNREEVVEEGGATQGRFSNEMNTTKSKFLTHFLKGKIHSPHKFDNSSWIKVPRGISTVGHEVEGWRSPASDSHFYSYHDTCH